MTEPWFTTKRRQHLVGGDVRLVRGPKRSWIQKRTFPGKTLNDSQLGRINNCGTTTMKHHAWQTGILALSVLLSLAACGKQQKTAAAATNAPTGNLDKLNEQARN